MKNYRAQTPQNLALTKILHKFRKTSTPLGFLQRNKKLKDIHKDRGHKMLFDLYYIAFIFLNNILISKNSKCGSATFKATSS